MNPTPPPLNFCPCCAKPLVARDLGGASRLACPDQACGHVFWNNPVPVVAGLVEHEGNVLLIQNVGWPPGWWGLVSGFLEAGETPEQGMVREVAEELGLTAELVGMIGVYSHLSRNQLILAYHLRAAGPFVQGPELAGVKPVPIARLKGWDSATGQAVTDWLRARGTQA